MCSEQTRLSRFVIEGHQGSEWPVCVYRKNSARQRALGCMCGDWQSVCMWT